MIAKTGSANHMPLLVTNDCDGWYRLDRLRSPLGDNPLSQPVRSYPDQAEEGRSTRNMPHLFMDLGSKRKKAMWVQKFTALCFLTANAVRQADLQLLPPCLPLHDGLCLPGTVSPVEPFFPTIAFHRVLHIPPQCAINYRAQSISVSGRLRRLFPFPVLVPTDSAIWVLNLKQLSVSKVWILKW